MDQPVIPKASRLNNGTDEKVSTLDVEPGLKRRRVELEEQDAIDLTLESTSSPPPALPSTDAPDGGYGWVCVLSLFLVNCFTWGAGAQSYGVFLGYYLANNVHPGATPIDYAFIGGFNLAMAMLVAPFVTILTRYWGIKVPMLIGVVLQTSGFLLTSWSNSVWQLYLTQGTLVGLGIGFTYVPSITVVSQWFDKRRSLANGICSAGSGIGGLIFSFATQAMIDQLSLAWALRVIGIVSGAMNLLATALVRDRNKNIDPTIRGFDFRLLRRPRALLLLSWAFVFMFGYVTLLYSLPAFARSIGLSDQQAANLSVFMNVATAIGRPLVGILSDRFGRMEVTGIVTLACGIATLAIWLPSTSYGVTIFFALFTGGILGVVWPALSPLCVEVVGLVDLQSLLSLSWLITVLPLAGKSHHSLVVSHLFTILLGAEVIALELRRPSLSDTYLYAQIFAGLSYILASLFMFALWRADRNFKKSL